MAWPSPVEAYRVGLRLWAYALRQEIITAHSPEPNCVFHVGP